jgi:hypothetical protein
MNNNTNLFGINNYTTDINIDTVSKDLIVKQLQTHIVELEQNEKTFTRLNKKFIELQDEYIYI